MFTLLKNLVLGILLGVSVTFMGEKNCRVAVNFRSQARGSPLGSLALLPPGGRFL